MRTSLFWRLTLFVGRRPWLRPYLSFLVGLDPWHRGYQAGLNAKAREVAMWAELREHQRKDFPGWVSAREREGLQ